MSSILDRLMKGLPFGKKPLTYDQEKELASHDNSEVREKLAAREDIRPEILYYLAEDSEPVVRRQIAANRKTPLQADLLLAKDGDEDVRCHLAEKIGGLAPNLSTDDTDRLSQYALSVLEILARDQLIRVRMILAETLKDITNAPPHVIQQLARDTEIEVSGPVLRYSPLLSDDDLLEIIKAGPIKGALVEIAQRSELQESVSDAIVAVDERDAITALLGNESAQIREETLDELISRAPGVQDWHAPLTKRPDLSFKAAQAIAGLVADSLLENMRGRSDLDPETLHMVEDEVHRRLLDPDGESPAKKQGGKGTAADTPSEAQDAERTEKARRMRDAGELTEKALTDSLKEGDHHFVATALSVLSEVSLKIVRGMVKTKNAWAMTALIRKAGLGMEFAVKCQKDMAAIPEAEIIHPAEDGDFPMSGEEEEATLGSFAEEFLEEEAEEEERLADPHWEKSGKTAGGPVDPDWAEGGAKTGQKRGVEDPDWSPGAKPGQKGGVADPDWAEGGAKPGQKGGVADPDWSSGAKPKTDDEFLEPDWARDDGGEEKAETAAEQGLPDPDWAVEEEPPEEPEGSEAGEGGDGGENKENGAESPENSQSDTDSARKA